MQARNVAELTTVAEVLIENGIPLDSIQGWERRWLTDQVVQYRPAIHGYIGGTPTKIGMYRAEASTIWPDDVFVKPQYPLYLGADGKLHQAA